MENQPIEPIVLMVDDDPDDHLLVQEALAENGCTTRLQQLLDGGELLDYLHGRGKHASDSSPSRPDLILLDLNMPGMDGREALRVLKECPEPSVREIPVVVLTTSRDQMDVQTCYTLGASSFIEKPREFERLVEIMKVLVSYWFDVSRLPKSAVA